MENQNKDYYIFNNNIIYYADKFDINKHVKIILDKNEYDHNKANENTYRPIIQNTIWNEQNNYNPGVYIYFDPIKLANNAIFSYNEKFHKSINDYSSRYFLAFNKAYDNYNQYKKVFKNIDIYMNNLKQKIFNSYYYSSKFHSFTHFNYNHPRKLPTLFYNCLSKDKFYYDTKLRKIHSYKSSKNVYYKIHFDPILKSFKYKSRMPFSYQQVFKIDKNNNINRIKYDDIASLAKDLHKGVYISTIINLNKIYFSPSFQHVNIIKPEVNYGIYPICSQIIIHENIDNTKTNKETNKEIIERKPEKIKPDNSIKSIMFLIIITFIGLQSLYLTNLLI